MKRLVPGLTALLLLASGATGAQADDAVIQTPQMRAALTVGRSIAEPGETLWVAVSFDLKPGWHTYWRTPGDAGEPITVTWTLPPGITAGPLQWPTPERFDYSGIAGFGYTGHAALLSEFTIDPSVVAPSQVMLAADLTWLSCAAVCIPEEGHVSVPLTIEAAGTRPDTLDDPAIAAARAALPRKAPWNVTATRTGDTLLLTAGPGVTEAALKDARYFPYDGAMIVNGNKQDFHLADGTLTLKVELMPGAAKHGDAAGVLRFDHDDDAPPVGYSFAAPIE
jgi:thiol:disulfide interchange protein DsbD